MQIFEKLCRQNKNFVSINARRIKGLVIFNPAVGGRLTDEGGQTFLKICLREGKKM